MPLAVRGNIKGTSSSLSAVTPALTGWTAATGNTGPATPQPGDLVICHGFVQGTTGSWSQTGDTSNPWDFQDTARVNSGGMVSFIATRRWQGSETGPTFTFSGTANRGAWQCIAVDPDAGFMAIVGAWAAVLVGSTAGTSFTPNSATALSWWPNTMSMLCLDEIASANGTTADSATFPTGYGTGGLGAASLAGTSLTKSSYAQNANNNSVSGTVTPGAVTAGVSSFATIWHLLVTEVPIQPPFWIGQEPGVQLPTARPTFSPFMLPQAGTATVTLTDSGAGADSLASSATASLTDSAGSSDALSVSVTVTLSDSASGATAIVATVTVPLADSASAADALTAAITSALADSGHGADTLAVSVSVSLPDAGSSSDAVVVSASVQLPDSGTGTDSIITGITKLLTDSATGGDALTFGSITVILADYGEGIDAVVQYPRLSDTGQGIESIGVSAQAGISDSGTGQDTIEVLNVRSVGLSDSGAGADSIVVGVDNTFTIILSDSGAGADAMTASAVAGLADSGAGADGLGVSVQMWLGYDDPVAEGHEPFDPGAAVIVVAPVWRLTPELFLKHMREMHNGLDPRKHAEDHKLGVTGHVHR